MPLYRCPIVLQHADFNQGWSENYWRNDTSNTSAQGALNNLSILRQAWMLTTTQILGYRVALAGPPRDGIVYPSSTGQGALDAVANPIAGLNDCLLVRLDRDAMDFFNFKYYRAVPEAIFRGRQWIEAQVPPAFLTPWTAFKQGLRTNGWLLHSPKTPLAPGDPITQVVERGRGNRATGRPFGLPRGRRPAA
jgi:hypothetical protein